MTNFKYGAFISYRRGRTDEKVARVLHRQLERYRTPRRLVRTGIASRIGQVYLDTVEREAAPDLDQALRSALDTSRWLIVVCSSRTPQSAYVSQEVAYFAASKRGKILPLLIEGEPEESYPKTLLEGGEPKAADIRSPTRAKALTKLKRSEKLALLAPMLGVSYDDLKLRERQRKRRQRTALGTLVGILLAVFAMLLWQVQVERYRSELFETLDGVVAAARSYDHQGAVQLAAHALSLNRERGLDRDHEIERVVRDAFDLPFFRRVIAEVPEEVRSVAASDDGSSIAVAARGEDLVMLKRASGGYTSRELDTMNEEITTLAFQPGTQLLAAGTANGIVFLFDSNERSQFELGFGRINQLAFSPDGERLAIASEDGLFLRGFKAADSTLLTIDAGSVTNSAAFGGTGEWLASTAGDEIVIRDIRSGSPETVCSRLALPQGYDALHLDMELHTYRLSATAFSYPEAVAFVWDDFRDPGTRRRLLTIEDNSIQTRFSRTGEILAFGGNTPMRFIDYAGQVSSSVEGVAPSVVELISSSNEIITIDSESGDLVGLDFFARALLPLELLGEESVRDLTFVGERSNRLGVVYQGASSPTLWQLDNLAPRRVSLAGTEPSLELISTALKKLVADPSQPQRLIGALSRVLYDDQNLVIWNPDRPGARESLPQLRGDANDVALAASGELLAMVGSIESVVRLHDFRNGKTKEFTVPSRDPLVTVSVTENGSATYVAVGDQHGRVFLINVADDQIDELTGAVDPAPSEFSIRFSPDSEWLAITGPAGVRVLRMADNFRPVELKPQATALDVAFSPDRTALFAAIDDGRVLRWSLDDPGQDAFVLRSLGPAATAVTVSPDDKAVAVGFTDGTIVVWPRFPEMVAHLVAATTNQR